MKTSPFKFFLAIAISLVWLINGLFCKVLNLVPRHQLIVARILGEDYSGLITKAIGLSEILMFLWVLSKLKSRWCSVAQIIVVATMNTIEFILAPDLLLFGRLNSVFSLLFISLILINEFVLRHKELKPT